MSNDRQRQSNDPARLTARPVQLTTSDAKGLHRLNLGGARDGLLYVPPGYSPQQPAPLVVMLHGAGGNADHALAPLRAAADAYGMILLAPDARRQSWDIILGGYGPDVAFINRALLDVFTRYAIDPNHLAVEGFSDGASYALSLGITNGDLFTHVLAFSPGFMAPTVQRGTPRLFISHGTRDTVLPIDRCSRKIIAQVQQAGYDATYHEFDGPHTVPPDIVQAALTWFADTPA